MGDMFKGTEGAQAAQKMQADSGDQLPGWMTRPTQAGQAYFGSRALAQPQPPTAGPLQEAAQPSAPLMTSTLASLANATSGNAPAAPTQQAPTTPAQPNVMPPSEEDENVMDEEGAYENTATPYTRKSPLPTREQLAAARTGEGEGQLPTVGDFGTSALNLVKPLLTQIRKEREGIANRKYDVESDPEAIAAAKKLREDLDFAGVDTRMADALMKKAETDKNSGGDFVRAVNELADKNAKQLAISLNKQRKAKMAPKPIKVASSDLTNLFPEAEGLDETQADAVANIFKSIGAIPS